MRILSKPIGLTLVVLLLLVSAASAATYSELYTQYCTPEILSTFNMTEEDRLLKRDSSVYLAVDADAVSEVIKTRNPNNALLKVGAATILSALLIIASLVSFIVFLCFCCCCDRAGSSSADKQKICWIVSAILIIGYAGVFIASAVLIGKVNSNNQILFCFSAGVVKHVLDGVTEQDFKFIGFSGLQNLLLTFVGEFDKMSMLTKDFDDIANKKLTEKSQKALASLPVFYNKYKDSATSDGRGTKSKPLTVQSLTTNINDAINQEFLLYDSVAQQLTQAAVVGKSYTNGASLNGVKDTLGQVATQVDSLKLEIESGFDTAVVGIDAYKLIFTIIYAVVLALGGILFIFSALIMLSIFCNLTKKRDNCRCCSKAGLGIMSFILIVTSLFATTSILLSITMGSICSLVGDLLEIQNASVYLNKFDISLNGTTGALVDQCLPAGASGDIANIFTNGTDILNGTKAFLDGLAKYDQIKNNITQAASSSISISLTVDAWNKFMVSIFPDQQKAVEALVEFNALVNCDNNLIYQLNAKNCTAQSNCKGIYDSASFTPPSCSANPSQATTLYTNLKAFTTDEQKLLEGMIVDLSGSAATTPLSLNAAIRTDLGTIVASLDNIKSKLTQTMAQASNLSGGFGKSVNCTIVRRELVDFEAAFCFNLNKNFYLFATLFSVAIFVFLLSTWMICCMLRYAPKYDLDEVFDRGQTEMSPQLNLGADHANNAAYNNGYKMTGENQNNYPNISSMNDTEYTDQPYPHNPANNYTANHEQQRFIK